MARGCNWPFSVGRGCSYNDIGEGARAAHDRFRDPTINQLIGGNKKLIMEEKETKDEEPKRD